MISSEEMRQLPRMTIAQACRAFNVARSTLYRRYLQTGRLAFEKVGAWVWIATADLEALFNPKGRVTP